MGQTVTVSLERRGNIYDLDTQSMALGKIHVDPDKLPPNEREGAAKRLLGSSALYCFIGSFADALLARGAEFHCINGTASVTAGRDDAGRDRVLGMALDVTVVIDERYADICAHVERILSKGCLISASLEPAFPITYNVKREHPAG